MTVGERIRKARKNAGLTQAQLAEILGISYVGVSQWESGKRNPKYETLEKIASALNVSISALKDIEPLPTETIIKNWQLEFERNAVLYEATDGNLRQSLEDKRAQLEKQAKKGLNLEERVVLEDSLLITLAMRLIRGAGFELVYNFDDDKSESFFCRDARTGKSYLVTWERYTNLLEEIVSYTKFKLEDFYERSTVCQEIDFQREKPVESPTKDTTQDN